jgi:hypothetical protein
MTSSNYDLYAFTTTTTFGAGVNVHVPCGAEPGMFQRSSFLRFRYVADQFLVILRDCQGCLLSEEFLEAEADSQQVKVSARSSNSESNF